MLLFSLSNDGLWVDMCLFLLLLIEYCYDDDDMCLLLLLCIGRLNWGNLIKLIFKFIDVDGFIYFYLSIYSAFYIVLFLQLIYLIWLIDFVMLLLLMGWYLLSQYNLNYYYLSQSIISMYACIIIK